MLEESLLVYSIKLQTDVFTQLIFLSFFIVINISFNTVSLSDFYRIFNKRKYCVLIHKLMFVSNRTCKFS